uniref:Uncharacterized protein n=1 Tax=Globodera pallida TaxID=36090 RepID=A0A183C1L8_GLOPA
MNNSAGGVLSPTDRTAMLATFRKNFAAFLKTKFNKNVALPSQAESDTKHLLVQFYKIMSHFTPDELCAQFKECISFTTYIAEELVHEIRRRASSENTREAALAVYEFVRAEPIDARGWMLLKTVIFISNSGSPKVFECFCKTLLPNTLIKTLLLAHQTDNEELKASIAILIKQLLYLAKNEQLFSSLLQLLFSEPEHIELCTVILKLFSNVLLESHKVRVMFRRSGGFICLLTLLLHTEQSLALKVPPPSPSDAQQMPSLSLEFVGQRDATLQYVALIFHVLTVSMRYEPSNSKYFLNEVRPSIINSILLNLGCFGKCAKVDTDNPIWETITLANCGAKLAAIHQCFGMGTDLYRPEKRGNGRRNGALVDLPHGTFNALIVMRLLLDLAFDNFEKSSNEFRWANANEWLQNVENLETVPVLAWSNSAVLAHPSALLSIVDLLPALSHPSNLPSGDCHKQNDAANTVVERPEADHTVAQLDEWSALTQLYIALTLKAILRSERNQQTMCQFDLPAKLLAVGEKLFKTDQHPLLSSFHYLFERLAYQSLRSSELRHFLRLDKPLCCTNLDDNDNEENNGSIVKAGGPIPIHRIKAFVSMLTPRNHSLLLSPAFVEFDLAIEGFAALVVPSLVRGGGKTNGGGGQHSLQQQQQQQQQSLGNAGGSSTPPATAADAEGGGGVTFPSSAGFTLAMWVNIVDFVGKKEPSSTTPIMTSSPSPESASASSTICLFSIVRVFEGNQSTAFPVENDSRPSNPSSYGHQLAANIENHQNCLQVLLQRVDYCWTLVVSGAEHSVADELRKDFSRGAEQCLQVPLSEQYFPPKQWAHLAVVISKHSLLLKSSNMYNCEVFINGHSLATQKLQLCWHSVDSNGQQPGLNAYIGTLPFFRRGSIQLRWRMASLCLVEEALGADVLRKMAALGVAYTGNYQTDVSSSSPSASSHSALIPEEKVLLSLNASASAETNVLSLRSMMPCRTEAELVAALVGISPNDQSTPLRLLWNITSCPVPCRPVPLGAVLIGYLGIRTFCPCPVSALLDSVGGMAPLLGTVVMSSDFSGLYASLKVLVCAVQTNRSVFVEMQRTRGFQTLAILLEDKASLMNSHILHLIFTLAGTVDDGSKEQVVIPNLQIFEDLLCDLDVWREAPREVWKLLLEHFFELLIETSASENLGLIRRSPLLGRLLVHLIENCSLFPVQNEISFRLIGAIVQPPCDGNSLLRLGQAIAATIAFDVDETAYPFSTAQLEQRLTAETASEDRRDEIRDLHLYAVYARNRLLNILCTMLHHSNSQMNKELSTLIVDTLGFGWILAFCGPRVHHGTLFLAMRILANLLRYPSLVNKFRDGSANGGWLSDADSVIRNRAAVLLGFSVANQVGAVGAHVDINPELDKCSGFASLEHVAYSHANKPFVYLALLSVLFQQHNPNIQPLGNFTIELVWSNVFGLDEQGSVADAIERAQFCPEIIVSLLATIRAAIHRQFEMEESNEQNANDWSTNYPLRLLQFFNFLYQNSSQFFAICHTESFVVVLFSSLLPTQNAPQTPNSARTSAEECAATTAEECGGNRCVKQSLELLTNILLNDLCLANEARTEPLFDALIEYMDCNGPTHNRQNQLFTELVNGCLDHFMSSKMFFLNSASVPLVVPPSAKTQLNQSAEYTSANVVRFLSRVIDTVWNGLYKGNPIRILKCFLKLLAEAHASNKAAAQLQCTDAHISSLFRLILYLLSRPIDNVDTQMCVLDTLAEIVRNQQLFLTPKSNVDPLFYAALVHLVFMLSDRPQFDLQDRRNRELERGTAQVSICAQSVWGILWQHKKAVLEEWLKKGDLDLDLFTSRAKCGEAANRAWLQFVDSQTNISMIKQMVEKNLEHTEKNESIDEDVKRKRESEQNVVFDEDELEEEEMDEEDEGMRDKSPKLTKEAEGTETAELELVEKTSTDGRKDICETEQKPLEMKKHHRRRDQSLGEPISQGPDNQTLLRLLEQGEKLHSMFRCARVQGLDIMEGLLLFGKDHFYVVDGFTLLKTREIRDLDFLPEQFHDPIIPYIAMGYRSRPLSTKVNRQCNKFAYDDIKEVHKRRYLLQQIALEVFSTDGRNFLLAFPRKVRDHVFQKLVSMAKNASSDVTQFMNEQKKLRPTETSSSLIAQLLTGQQQSITHKWLRGEISNFHYLMYLNTLAGRSYNDLSQYPVFPWVLADYDSDRLDLTNPASFRDFSMPMGAQNCDRLAQFLKRFREWDDPGGTPPYMYGTHYSSAMIVLSYLVRLEPFTQQFLKLQGGHFDLADRMFHSVRDAFWSAARNNMADVKELIPEFFFLPEMFLNENAFDLGVKQNGTQLDDVLLPPWANGDPHEFVRLHRQALECDFVSEHLHEWIDLIFGYKQTGDAAREANNVFHHLFYETSIDIETIEDPLTRNATLGFINNFGQIPAQLFKKQHPQRKIQGGHPPNALPLVSPVPGLSVPRLFYHCPEALRVSARPVKELRTAVGEIIVGERGNQAVVLEQNKVLVPPNSFLAWGFYDRSVRFGAVGHEKSTCILETNDVYEITCMATTDGRQVFAGLSTGTVFVWSFCLPAPSSSVSASLSVSKSVPNARLTPKRALSAHSDVVTALAANAAHNVLVSGSRDRTVVVWHLTRLGFIRQLAIHPGPVSAVAINEAKGDIATASGAWLFLWTINGTPLASVNTADSGGLFSNASSLVLCITFSMSNDWDENNVVLCGTSDGLVKMYSLERMSKTLNDVDEDRHSSKLADPNLELYQQQQSVREHLFRRQQRIQQHHHSFRMAKSPVKTAVSLESSPSTSTVNSATFSRQTSQQPTTPTLKLNNSSSSSSNNNQHEQQQRDVQCPPIGMEEIRWRRTFRLRRILSEHTAFTAGNSQPAPITAIRATKDHRSLLIGDGIGRIWMWSIVGRSDSDGQPQQQSA